MLAKTIVSEKEREDIQHTMDTFTVSNLVKCAEAAQIINNGKKRAAPCNKFGVLLRVLRRSEQMSVAEIALMSGLSAKTIQGFELGKLSFEDAIGAIPALAKALHVDPYALSNILLKWVL